MEDKPLVRGPKKKKTGGKDWVKGQSGNPKGRPPVPEHLRIARKMNKAKFQEILQKYIHCSVGELKETLLDPKSTAIELSVVKILHESILKGDQKRLEFILDRLIGKVRNELDVTTGGETLNGDLDLSKLSDKELEKMQVLLEKCQK